MRASVAHVVERVLLGTVTSTAQSVDRWLVARASVAHDAVRTEVIWAIVPSTSHEVERVEVVRASVA